MYDLSNPDSPTANLPDLVRFAATAHPRATFRHLGDGEQETEQMTTADLWRRARAIAVAVREAGAAGKTVIVPCPPGLAFTPAMIGAIAAGAVPVPTPPPTGDRAPERMTAIAASAGAVMVLAPASLTPQRAVFPPTLTWLESDSVPDSFAERYQPIELLPDAVAYLQYTSGSTSQPRGVSITHRNVLRNCADVQEAYHLDPSSMLVGWVPAHHDLGLIYGVLVPMFVGCSSVTLPADRFVERPIRWLRAIHRWRGTHVVSPNFGYELTLARTTPADRAELDLSCWTTALNGAEPVRRATEQRFAEAFAGCGFDRAAFSHSYGLSEATAKVTAERTGKRGRFFRLDAEASTRHEVAPAVDGRPAIEVGGCGEPASTRLVIVDPDERVACPPGRIGEIWLAGPSVAAGYAGHPEATAETFGAQLAGDGGRWLRTGDLGFVHDGDLYVTGRCKDLLVVRGENRYPQDLEWSVQGCHPSVRPGAAAAFAVDDGAREQLVLATEVYPDKVGDGAAALAAIREAVAEHGVRLDTVVLVRPQGVPKTSSGKVRRAATRSALAQGMLPIVLRWDAPPESDAAPAPAPAGSGLDAKVVAVVAARLGCDPAAVKPGVTFKSLGMDSIAAVEIGELLAAELGMELYPGVVQDHGTLDALVAHLESERA